MPKDHGGSVSTHPVRFISGLEPVKLFPNVIRFSQGSITDFDGNNRYDFIGNSDVDLTTNGLWGLDTGTVSDGSGIYFYVITDGTDTGIMASKSTTQGGVVYPSGFSFVRKLQFGFIYNSAWGGIPYFFCAHWPTPFMRFTSAESTAAWCALSAGDQTSWTDIDLSPWLPDNARMALVQLELRYSGTGGDASTYVRSDSSVGASTGLLVGTIGPANTRNASPQWIRVTSSLKFQYKNNAAPARLYVYVLGYQIDDPV
jgi:hypothetical protein